LRFENDYTYLEHIKRASWYLFTIILSWTAYQKDHYRLRKENEKGKEMIGMSLSGEMTKEE